MNPFIAFCLYVAARVFIHILKKGPDEAEIRSSFEFLLMAMQQFKTTNPLSESFLIQLGLDLQGSGMDFLLQNHTQSSTTLAKLKIIVSRLSPFATNRSMPGADIDVEQIRSTRRLFADSRHTRQE